VTVTDQFGSTATQTYTLTVTHDTTPPSLDLRIDPFCSPATTWPSRT
jgi:hypothetical protein